MNKNKLKSYAQKARREFIQAVTDRAHFYGMKENGTAACEVKGDFTIINGRPFPKRVADQRNKLEERIKCNGFAQVMEQIAYTWFNRFVAIRYMELHGFLSHGYRVLSHPSGENIPEILEKAQYVRLSGLDKNEVVNLKMDGTKDDELYRLLIVAQCNELSKIMPFLFEEVADCTELLLPDNLLHSNSLIRKLADEIDGEDWQNVQIIGWLYQFYISEKKESLIKAKKAYKSEDIPAATQLFTPNWIVKYMVQNSLGAQWMRTYPDSSLKNKMEYYIEPAEQTEEVNAQLKEITPGSLNPEELTLLDPACGSGHILVEAYDLLKEIYLERGYRKCDIPQLILIKNLFGLEIDDRAAQLAGFALMMKAREDDRQIFDRAIQPAIVSIQQSNDIDSDAIIQAADNTLYRKTSKLNPGHFSFVDNIDTPLFAQTDDKRASTKSLSSEIKALLNLFEDAKTFGSLICIPDRLAKRLPEIVAHIDEVEKGDDLFKIKTLESIKPLIIQAKLLSQKYDVVVANPPYMGNSYLNPLLKEFIKDEYKGYEKDLFSAFIIRNRDLAKSVGDLGFMSPFVWMFISSYEQLRINIIDSATVTSLIQLEYSGFAKATVPICTFTFNNTHLKNYTASFIRLSDFRGADNQAPRTLEAIRNKDCGWFYRAKPSDFKKIPDSPIAYWIKGLDLFRKDTIGKHFISGGRNKTHNNIKYLRFFWEVNSFGLSSNWVFYSNGGDFRKYYGNIIEVVNWTEKARKEYDSHGGLCNPKFWGKEGITWSLITSSISSFRIKLSYCQYSSGSPTIFNKNFCCDIQVLALLNSKIMQYYLPALNPTLNTTINDIFALPFVGELDSSINTRITNCIEISKKDWDSFETSWDFKDFPMLSDILNATTVKQSYLNWGKQCKDNIARMKELEEENNHIFIEAYGLQYELTPDVPEEEITLARPDKEEDMKRLISYATGCMMGRYSLDVKGLVYANSGNEGFDSTKYTTFPADDDGIIPITDTEWFDDDAAFRFFRFIESAWSKDTLEDNLEFIATCIGQRTDETSRDAIRRYFVSGFFKDHLKTYKKRPIYWLFTSGKEKAFQALVYLHRYNEGTLSRMRTEYVLPLQSKIATKIEHLEKDKDQASSTSAAVKIQKEIDKLRIQKDELLKFDEKLHHYADMKIKLDLDDGVKVNYDKFGDLLAEVKAVTGSKE